MKNRGVFECRRMLALLGAGATLAVRTSISAASSHAVAIPSAVTTCACASLADFETAALAYFNTWHQLTPPGFPAFPTVANGLGGPGYLEVLDQLDTYAAGTGTHVTVVSTTYALSADFYFTPINSNHPNLGYKAVPISAANDAGTRSFDGMVYARSAKMPPIKVPGDIPNNETPEVISQYVQTQLQATGPIGTDLWHGLTNFGQFVKVTLLDAQTGKTYDLYVGDTITLQFADGSTEKFQYMGPYSTSQWIAVPGTLRDANGNDPTKPPPAQQSNPVGGAGVGLNWPFDPTQNDGSWLWIYPWDSSNPIGIITIECIENPGCVYTPDAVIIHGAFGH